MALNAHKRANQTTAENLGNDSLRQMSRPSLLDDHMVFLIIFINSRKALSQVIITFLILVSLLFSFEPYILVQVNCSWTYLIGCDSISETHG